MRGRAMSFTEIGAAFGISRQSAFETYRNAMRKLHRRSHSIAAVQQLRADFAHSGEVPADVRFAVDLPEADDV